MYTKGDMKITVDACKCDLCGHVWLPERCAKCKRLGWNDGEKTRDAGKKEKPTAKPRKVKGVIGFHSGLVIAGPPSGGPFYWRP